MVKKKLPFGETESLLTAAVAWMVVTGALMLRRSQTLTERSSEPEMICSVRLKAALVTVSV